MNLIYKIKQLSKTERRSQYSYSVQKLKITYEIRILNWSDFVLVMIWMFDLK